MKILSVKSLAIPDVYVIRSNRFLDDRGYFTEIFRKSDFTNHPQLSFFKNVSFLQMNESYSKKNVLRGLHTQWNPYMGKLLRTINGHMVDLVLDIRKNSKTFGKIIAYDMPQDNIRDYFEWIWIPQGFAHGNFFLKETTIQYCCTSEYSPGNEAGINPLSSDIDWSLCDKNLRDQFRAIQQLNSQIMSTKDKSGFSLKTWLKNPESDNFV